MDHVFGIVSKQSSPNPRSSRFSPMLSSIHFIVLHFTFRSLIHFELIFVKSIRSVSRFIFLHVDVQHYSMKRPSLFYCIGFSWIHFLKTLIVLPPGEYIPFQSRVSALSSTCINTYTTSIMAPL